MNARRQDKAESEKDTIDPEQLLLEYSEGMLRDEDLTPKQRRAIARAANASDQRESAHDPGLDRLRGEAFER